MHRARPAWSVLLLALFLGIWSPAGAPVDARAGAAMLPSVAGAGSTDAHYVRTATSLRQSLEWRSPTDRQPSIPGGALRSRPVLPLLVVLRPGARASRHVVRAGRAAGRFPNFPTGPPSLS